MAVRGEEHDDPLCHGTSYGGDDPWRATTGSVIAGPSSGLLLLLAAICFNQGVLGQQLTLRNQTAHRNSKLY